MKLNKYFMIGAMGLSLVACSDNLDDNQGVNGNASNEGSTYAALKIDFGSSSASRAIGDQPGDDEYGEGDPSYTVTGDGNEKAIKELTIIVTDKATNRVEHIEKISSDKIGTIGTTKYTFEITPGIKNFFAYANQTISATVGGQWTGNETTDANIDVLAPFQSESEDEGQFTEFFPMSSVAIVSQDIKDGIEESDVESGENNVSISIERMVAKTTVQLSTAFDTNSPFTNQAFTVSSLTAQIGNAENKSYNGTTMDDGAASYLIAQNENGVRVTPYSTYPNNVTWTNFDEDATNALLSGTPTELYTPSATDKTPTLRFYCKENTHGSNKANYVESNTTFVRVVATMFPNEVIQFACATSEDKKTISVSKGTPASQAATFYKVIGNGDNAGAYVMASQLATLYGEGETCLVNGDAETEDDKAAAVVAELEKSYDYEFENPYIGGKGYYDVWVNHILDKTTPGAYLGIAPVFRNDWYDLTINNIVLPGDPDPTIDPDQPIDPTTYMAVTLAIRDWNKVSHGVDLQ